MESLQILIIICYHSTVMPYVHNIYTESLMKALWCYGLGFDI